MRKTDPWDPESSTLHLAPRALSAGVVVSLGEGFYSKADFWINVTDMEALGAFMSDPAEVQWDQDNGAVYKAYSMQEMG